MPNTMGVADATEIIDFLDTGQRLGIEIPPDLRDKIDRLAAAKEGHTRVALVGGFSEGKTALAAAWLGKVPDDMRISQTESSDKVTIYDAGDGVELIDTPGLFGFKEGVSETGAVERYRDVTRKWVSQADLLLYVLNPSNPLKESHREELEWLLRGLQMLPRTVFVIGRFDMVADLEDPEDFHRSSEIKAAGVRSRLRDAVGLTDEEAAALPIIAVSANPFGKGVRQWLAQPEEYGKLSRLPELRAATASRLEAFGGSDAAKQATCLTIIKDVTQRLVPPAREAADVAQRGAGIADEKAREEEPRLARYRREAGEAQIALSRQIRDHLADIIVEARSTDLDDFQEFFDRRIGRDGVVLESMMRDIFTDELGPISRQLVVMSTTFANETAGDMVHTALGKVGDMVGGGAKITNKHVLKMRDWVLPSIKFKPYDAIKTAKFANGALAGIGFAIEGWTFWDRSRKLAKFQEDRQAIVTALEDQRAALLTEINAPDFLCTYFPQLTTMEELFAMLASAFRDAAEHSRQVQRWATEAETLRDRFRLASANHGQFDVGAADW